MTIRVTPSLTATAVSNLLGIQKVRRSVDSSAVTASTTLASDDSLLWAVAANEVWFFEAFLRVAAANATMDVKFGWSVPTGTTMSWGAKAGLSNELPGYGTRSSGNLPLALLTESQTIAIGTLTGTGGISLAGIVVVSSTPGNVNLQWAQNTSDAGELTMRAHSFIRATRVS